MCLLFPERLPNKDGWILTTRTAVIRIASIRLPADLKKTISRRICWVHFSIESLSRWDIVRPRALHNILSRDYVSKRKINRPPTNNTPSILNNFQSTLIPSCQSLAGMNVTQNTASNIHREKVKDRLRDYGACDRTHPPVKKGGTEANRSETIDKFSITKDSFFFPLSEKGNSIRLASQWRTRATDVSVYTVAELNLCYQSMQPLQKPW